VVRNPGDRQGGGDSLGPWMILLAGLWFGVMVGFLELLERLAVWNLSGRIRYDTLRTNWHYSWMIPVSNLVLFGAAGLLLAVICRLWRRIGMVPVVPIYIFLGLFSLGLEIPGLHLWSRVIAAAGLARLLGQAMNRYGPAIGQGVAATLPWLLVALGILVGWRWSAVAGREALAESGLPNPRPGAPDVLLLVLDTTRADALTPYGATRDTTPHLARLASQGVRFNQARSTSPWTLPSHASLFTGLWPHEHQANVGRPIAASGPTLAEFFASQGYRTGAFVANTENCNAWYGFDRGFARYEDYYENTTVTPLEVLRASRLGQFVLTSKFGQGIVKSVIDPPRHRYRKTAAMIGRDALAWLDRSPGRPAFLFLNYFDAHDPYIPPPGASRQFAAWATASGRATSPRDHYDDCLAYLDQEIGKLLDELARRGRLDHCLIVVTSDHGEAFGEHGLSGHGISLYRPEMHVPLLIRFPPRAPAGRVVELPVSLRDLPATIARLAAPEIHAPFPGTSLAACWEPPSGQATLADPPSPVFSEVHRAEAVPLEMDHAPARRGQMWSLVTDRFTYIRNGDGAEELFDLRNDPNELQNLVGTPTAYAELPRLRSLLTNLRAESSPPQPTAPNRQVVTMMSEPQNSNSPHASPNLRQGL